METVGLVGVGKIGLHLAVEERRREVDVIGALPPARGKR